MDSQTWINFQQTFFLMSFSLTAVAGSFKGSSRASRVQASLGGVPVAAEFGVQE